ncbi:hypothetical protein AF72_12365 [Xylella taiwanensis]|uniref:Transposase n=1 Tax=Xylella taiwanensis TaxID=1444770 RepID=Z9JH49_9GAMM|nr:hypothetical protein AF72_12365 [Xylella taiwanensis]
MQSFSNHRWSAVLLHRDLQGLIGKHAIKAFPGD